MVSLGSSLLATWKASTQTVVLLSVGGGLLGRGRGNAGGGGMSQSQLGFPQFTLSTSKSGPTLVLGT